MNTNGNLGTESLLGQALGLRSSIPLSNDDPKTLVDVAGLESRGSRGLKPNKQAGVDSFYLLIQSEGLCLRSKSSCISATNL